MNVQIRTKDVNLDSTTKAHIESAIETFTKYQLDITTVNTNIVTEKKGVTIEFDIHVAHTQPVVITQTDDNLNTAIDLAIDRATKALRRLHDKVSSKQTGSIKDINPVDA